jgi:hypothetical protein
MLALSDFSALDPDRGCCFGVIANNGKTAFAHELAKESGDFAQKFLENKGFVPTVIKLLSKWNCARTGCEG